MVVFTQSRRHVPHDTKSVMATRRIVLSVLMFFDDFQVRWNYLYSLNYRVRFFSVSIPVSLLHYHLWSVDLHTQRGSEHFV